METIKRLLTNREKIRSFQRNVKDKNATFNIKWNVVKQYPAYSPVSKRCMLYAIYEKLAILENEGNNLLIKDQKLYRSVGIKINTCWQR